MLHLPTQPLVKTPATKVLAATNRQKIAKIKTPLTAVQFQQFEILNDVSVFLTASPGRRFLQSPDSYKSYSFVNGQRNKSAASPSIQKP